MNRRRMNAPFRSGATWALLIVALAGLWGPGQANAAVGVTPTGSYAWIAEEMIEIRGLPLLHEVKERHITRAELQDEVAREWIAEAEHRAELEASQRTMTVLGLIPEDTDLLSTWQEAYGAAVAGYYDPETEEIVLISDSEVPDAISQIVYAHEFVHALTDQHFDLGALQDRVFESNDGEAEAALSALIEGDATFAQWLFMSRHDDLLEEARAASESDDSDYDIDLPRAISEEFGFPYDAGFYFVEALLAGGGWEAVNAAYRNLPVSTEQILHPELYQAGERPALVDLPDLGAVLGQGWTLVDEDTLGEFAVDVLLYEEAPTRMNVAPNQVRHVGHDPAVGTNGGRYATWANGSQTAIIWVSRWDTDMDALEFERAMASYDARRWGAGAVSIPARTTVDGEAWSSRIVRSGTRVIYVLAPSPTQADALLAAVVASTD